MNYSKNEIMQYIEEEDVKFIRLAFCDVYGNQKNISVMPDELPRIFEYGEAIDASAISGFGGDVHSDLFLRPDLSTLTVLPWRPEHGRVVRMFCDIYCQNGKPFECDTRNILKNAIKIARNNGYSFTFGSELEFYLFKTDEEGNATKVPYDNAGYMDIAPEDKGENVRREICLTLERMGIKPESSHHEEGPGQNEIDFRYSDPLTAADNAVTFRAVVKTIAARNGLYADFSPKPLIDKAGNGFHINISAKSDGRKDLLPSVIAGILDKIKDMTVFLNPVQESYERLGKCKAPKYISWSPENRSHLIRVPAAADEYRRLELRSPDPLANPYLAFALDGLLKDSLPPVPADTNLYTAGSDVLSGLDMLPSSLKEAAQAAVASTFISKHLPQTVISAYMNLLG